MPTKKVDLTGFYFVQGDGKLSQNYADLINSVDICETETNAEPIYPIRLSYSGETLNISFNGSTSVNSYVIYKHVFGWNFIDYLYYKIFGKLAPWRKGVF